MENKDVKMPPKTRGPMRGPGRGMMKEEKAKNLLDTSAKTEESSESTEA